MRAAHRAFFIFVPVLGLSVVLWFAFRAFDPPRPFLEHPRVQSVGDLAPTPTQGQGDRSSEPSVAASRPARVRIRANVAGASQEPVSGALVYWSPDGAHGGLPEGTPGMVSHTDESGSSVLEISSSDLPGTVVAQRAGFRPGTACVSPDDVSEEGDAVVSLVVEGGLGIEGRVIDHHGGGVSGVEVRGFGQNSGGIWRGGGARVYAVDSLPDVHTTTTDVAGAFRLGGLRNGWYYITAVAPGLASSQGDSLGPREVRSGKMGVELRVGQCRVIAVRFLDAMSGDPVSLGELFVRLDGLDGIPGREFQVAQGDRVLGRSYGVPPKGVWVRHLVFKEACLGHGWARLRVSGLGHSSDLFKVSLAQFDPDSSPQVMDLKVRPPSGPSGVLRVTLCPDSADQARHVSPYYLRLRQDPGARWEGRALSFGTSSSVDIRLPAGRYRVAGKYLGTGGAETLGTDHDTGNRALVIPDGGVSNLRINIPRNALGSVEFSVSTGVGVPVSDYFYRLVTAALWERKLYNRAVRRSFVGGEASASARISFGGLEPGKYVLIIDKLGFKRCFAPVRIQGGACSRAIVVLGK
jgi:hypothetical protein